MLLDHVLRHRIGGLVRELLQKVGGWIFERDLQRHVVDRLHPELAGIGDRPLVQSLAVLDGVEQRRVLRRRLRQKDALQAVDKVAGRDGGAVRPDMLAHGDGVDQSSSLTVQLSAAPGRTDASAASVVRPMNMSRRMRLFPHARGVVRIEAVRLAGIGDAQFCGGERRQAEKTDGAGAQDAEGYMAAGEST